MDGMEAINATFIMDRLNAVCAAHRRIGGFFNDGNLNPTGAVIRMDVVPRSGLLWYFRMLSFTRQRTPTRGFFNSLSPPCLFTRDEQR
jgi:hypothetical protein